MTAFPIRPAREAEGRGEGQGEAGTPSTAAATLPAQQGVPRTRRRPTRGSEASRGHAASSALLSWPAVEFCGVVRKEGPRAHSPGQGQGSQSRSASGQLGHPGQPTRAGGDRPGPRFPRPRKAHAACARACAHAAPSPVQCPHSPTCRPSHPRPDAAPPLSPNAAPGRLRVASPGSRQRF